MLSLICRSRDTHDDERENPGVMSTRMGSLQVILIEAATGSRSLDLALTLKRFFESLLEYFTEMNGVVRSRYRRRDSA
jgi:hypothetical protein